MRASRTSLFFVGFVAFVGAGVVCVGCGGSADIGGDEGADTGSAEDSGITNGDGATTDSGNKKDGVSSDTTPSGDTTPASDASDASDTTPPGCLPLGAGATDVYVDKRYTGTSTGTAACPFTTILAGVAAAATLSGAPTIHVAGDTPSLFYNETGSVLVDASVTLRGDGPGKTGIIAAGSCSGGGTCAVTINGGGTLEGFTVASPSGDAIVAAGSGAAPIVRNCVAAESKGNGIVALGAVELGPDISAIHNLGAGVDSKGDGLVHVHAPSVGGSNTFDNNGSNGINVEGNATLQFDGGTANGNTFNGIRLAGPAPASSSVVSHVITGLTAKNNKNTGISLFHGQSLKLRGSTLLGNTNLGLFYTYAPGGVLDVGLATDAGGNVFGGATVGTRNGKAGIYLCRSIGAGTLPGEGDSWSVCPPTQMSMSGCDATPASYVDVAYAPAVAGDPVVAASCAVGP